MVSVSVKWLKLVRHSQLCPVNYSCTHAPAYALGRVWILPIASTLCIQLGTVVIIIINISVYLWMTNAAIQYNKIARNSVSVQSTKVSHRHGSQPKTTDRQSSSQHSACCFRYSDRMLSMRVICRE